jgi:outer membrane protein assembly factor BamA
LPAIRSRFRMRRMLLLKALRRFALLAFAAAALYQWPSASRAQSDPAPLLGAIHASGQKRFSEGKVIAASGLQTGQIFDVKAIEAATQKLGQSGAFDEVQFKYHPDNGKMSVEFVVKEAARFHRCTYDNFVWANSNEIEDFVRAEIPLFDGYAPESGNLPDEIARSLERFLKQRRIAGQVERVQYARAIGDPNWEHLYSANGPIIKVESVVFQGVKGIDDGLLQKEAKPLVGRNYSLVECRRYAEASFVPVYRERGFLRVNIGNPAGQLLEQTGSSSEFAIQINYPVEEGLAYDWGGAGWDGNREATTEALNTLLGMKDGERANGKKIDAGWEAVHAAYEKKGHLEAIAKPNAVYDEASHKVTFHVVIVEGPQYRMGEFSVKGVPVETGERLKTRWKLKSGDIYDASYMAEFVKTQMGPALGAYGGKGSKIQTSVRPDRVAHTVDVLVEVQ